MFKELSPQKIAKELTTIAKIFEKNKQTSALAKEIEALKEKLQNIQVVIKHTKNPERIQRLQVIADRMEATLRAKEKEYNKLDMTKNKLSYDWCI